MDLNTGAASGTAQTGVNALMPGSGQTPVVPIVPAPPGDKPIAARQAARDLASWRHNRDKRNQEQQQDFAQRHSASQTRMDGLTPGIAAAAAADPVQESSLAPSGASEDAGDLPSPQGEGGPPGETESADPVVQLPPIEPPRSWTKEDKELFTSLPRATQERIAERERLREGDFSRRQQEATEQRNALAAEQLMAGQVRQQYENALPLLLTELQQQQAGEFADIRTAADVERLAREDWPRLLRWDLQQQKVAAVRQQLSEAQGRQFLENLQQFSDFAKRQDELFIEKVPDMVDKAKAAALRDAAAAVLKDHGFSDAELGQMWQGQSQLSLRDHRLQLVIHDAIQWRDAQQKAKAAATRTFPPVQRPGVSQPRGAARDAQIQNLTKRLETSGSLKDAAALLRARRAAR
jgi:hypothetical protein